MAEPPPTRKLTIIAKDPGLRLGGPAGPMAFTQVSVPAEILAPGPTGYRIKVVDYNATEQRGYVNNAAYQIDKDKLVDPFAPGPGEDLLDPAYQARLLANPNFHAQNAYAIAMRTLGMFERALGRRVSWSTGGHQLHIAPHAFAQANAFYSEPDRALMFGYFHRDDGTPVFTCLSHDIVAHETTHALLDGLRSRYTQASGPDQAGFHEGFADIVALLSIFSMKQVVAAAIGEDGKIRSGDQEIPLVEPAKLKTKAIRNSIIFGLACEVGRELERGEHDALRRSVELTPKEGAVLRNADDEHARGEVMAAAMMNAFLMLWARRIETLGKFANGQYNLDAVVEEGAALAGHLLTMAIRALDYCPPTDMDFGQYLAAMLTADSEVVPEDDRGYRKVIRRVFRSYGIVTPSSGCGRNGCWLRFRNAHQLTYSRSNYAAMTRNPEEMFRFLWENRGKLNISERAYTEVLSIDAASRIGPDGIAVHETVCQYVQRFDLFGSEFRSVLGAERPDGMDTKMSFTAFGGGVVILDQYGQVKYHIANPIFGGERQRARARYLLDTGRIGAEDMRDRLRFAVAHFDRMGA